MAVTQIEKTNFEEADALLRGVIPRGLPVSQLRSLIGLANFVAQNAGDIPDAATRMIMAEKVAEGLGDMLAVQSFTRTPASAA